ncbi:MAG: LysR family transcriptional regulator [Pseudomonadota bacterium]
MNESDELRDWADMRLFLALVDHGTLVAAAEHLGLSQPTLGRRLTALQKRMGTTLFTRDGRRLALTDAGHAIVENARRMQSEMHAIGRALDVQSSGLSGTVTISATEGTGTEWLAPELRAFHDQYPDIVLNLLIEARAVDLVRREADIALRIGEPTQPDLIARKLVKIGFGWYASREWLARNGPIKSEEEVLRKDIVGFASESQAPGILPLVEAPPDATMHFSVTSNSMAARMSAIRAGYGVGVASHRWATMYPELVNVFPGRNVGSADLWIVTHEELRHSARIRAVFDYLSEHVRNAAEAFETGFEGEAPAA